MPRLENWFISADQLDTYKAPELQKIRLCGEIYNDEKERFVDGTIISSSSIQELNIKENYAMTRNTKYILGKPSSEYIEWLESQGKTLEDYIK